MDMFLPPPRPPEPCESLQCSPLMFLYASHHSNKNSLYHIILQDETACTHIISKNLHAEYIGHHNHLNFPYEDNFAHVAKYIWKDVVK